MAVKIRAELVGGRGPSFFVSETRRALTGAVRAGVEAATLGLRDDMRADVESSGLGRGLANAVGVKLYPDKGKATLHPTGFVFPRGKLAAEIFDALNRGVPIHARNRKYLAVPTRNAFYGGRGGHRLTPREFEARSGVKLFVVKSKRPGVLLLMGRKYRGTVGSVVTHAQYRAIRTSVVYFILIQMVRPGPRLSFEALAQRWADRIPGLIERATPGNF